MKTKLKNKAFIENETPQEFQYLEHLIAFRLGYGRMPSFPDIHQWSLPLKNFILNSQMTDQEDGICLLLIALAPHVIPELFDRAIQEKIWNYCLHEQKTRIGFYFLMKPMPFSERGPALRTHTISMRIKKFLICSKELKNSMGWSFWPLI